MTLRYHIGCYSSMSEVDMAFFGGSASTFRSFSVHLLSIPHNILPVSLGGSTFFVKWEWL